MQPRFEILGPVHRSAFSTIDRARDHQSGSLIALKRPLKPSAHWQQEAIALDGIAPHPNLVLRLSEGSDEHGPFRALEWIDGTTLDALIVDEVEASRILRDILTGLDHLHRSGFIHGDVSPANVMRPQPGDAKLIDLGTAVPIAEATANLVGSIHCMAPERFDSAPPSVANDLYAVGIIGYHLLTGRYPFEGDTTAQIITAHHRQAPTPLPPGSTLAPLIAQFLARDPSARPASAAQALQLLPV